MKFTYDIYAETNPSFCAANLMSFAIAHYSVKGTWPELITAYFVLPVSLSQELVRTLEGTNKVTGLMVWLGRNPEVPLVIAERVRATAGITKEAVSFGCFSKLLAIDRENGRLKIGDRIVDPIKAGTKAGKDAERAVKMSQRLGYWFAENGTSKSIYSAFGVNP